MRLLALIVTVLAGALLVYATLDFPDWADPSSPASVHVSPRYIERAVEETGTPNFVTAVLADYRGYDTLGEVIVIFTAGMVCIMLLRRTRND